MVALTITLLRFNKNFIDDYPNHRLVTRMRECSIALNLNDEKIKEWTILIMELHQRHQIQHKISLFFNDISRYNYN